MLRKTLPKIIVFIDGGSRGNPGPAAFGVVFQDQFCKTIKEFSQVLGKATNNQAEYSALIFAFKKAKALFGKDYVKKTQFEIRSDSELLVRQMQGKYKIKEQGMQALFLEAWNLKIDFGDVKLVLIKREDNKRADRLLNEALDAQTRKQTLF